MKVLMTSMLLFTGALFLNTANAYDIKGCSSDSCKVYCDNGQYVGTMYWNGTRWSDGLRSHEKKDVVASQMVAAQGTACR